MKKNILKIIISLIVIVAIFFTVKYITNINDGTDRCQITVIVVDENKNEIINDKLDLKYDKNSKPSLLEVLKDNYTVVTGQYGMPISIKKGSKELTIDESKAYIAFYYNENYASYGLDTQPYTNNDVIKLVYEVIIW